jgi:hypothetical protein
MIMKTKGLDTFVFWALYLFREPSGNFHWSKDASLFLKKVPIVDTYVSVLVI